MPDYPETLFSSLEELQNWLSNNNVPIEQWGKGYAKTINQLFLELQRRECIIKTNPPMRILTVVQIIIKHDDLILVELSQEMQDQRRRKRSLPPSEKMKPGEGWHQAAVRCLDEELSIQENQFTILSKDCKPDIYEKQSQSYPGLLSQYHLYRVHVAADHLPKNEFWTVEKIQSGQKQAVRRHLWGWVHPQSIKF